MKDSIFSRTVSRIHLNPAVYLKMGGQQINQDAILIKRLSHFFQYALILSLFSLPQLAYGSLNCKLTGSPVVISEDQCAMILDGETRTTRVDEEKTVDLGIEYFSYEIYCSYYEPEILNHWSSPSFHYTIDCSPDEYYLDLTEFDTDDKSGEDEIKSCPASNTSGPINLLNGNNYRIHKDVLGVVPGSKLRRPSFTRTYNSQSNNSGPNVIGHNWRHNYQSRIEVFETPRSGINTGEPLQSSLHTNKWDACEIGFSQVVAKTVGNNTQSRLTRILAGSVSWENDQCISRDANGREIAKLQIKIHDPEIQWAQDQFLHSLYVQLLTLHRANGNQYRFRKSVTPSGTESWNATSASNFIQVKAERSGIGFDPTQSNVDFIIITGNGTKETYAFSGELLTIEYLNGIIETLTYTNDQLTRVDSNLGHSLVFAYNENGHIESITDDAARTWQYQYDTQGRLVKVINPDSTEKNYPYEDVNFSNALSGLIDERGIRYSTFEYHLDGLAKSSYRGSPGAIPSLRIGDISVVYGATSNTVTNSRGNVATYYFSTDVPQGLLTQYDGPECDGCAGGSTSAEYDINLITPEDSTFNLLSRTVYGVKTDFTYDAGNPHPKTVTKAAGTAKERQKSYTYDSQHKHKAKTVTTASVSTGNNKVTTRTYDDFANTTSVAVAGFKPDGTAVNSYKSFAYDGPLHQLTEINGARTDVDDRTFIEYYPDEAAQNNNRARVKKVTAPLGIVLYDNVTYTATGKISDYTTGNNLQVSFVYYTGNDRLEKITQKNLTTLEERVTYLTYIATGEVQTITSGYGTADATTITLEYDAARRLTHIYDGADTATSNYIKYTLDTEGNVVNEEVFGDNVAPKKSLTQIFDAYNRLNINTQANESKDIDFSADGTLDRMIDGNDVTTNYSYDELRRLSEIKQDEGGTNPTTQNATTTLDYDVRDNLTSVTDPINGTTTYVYDDLGNLLSKTSPDTGTSTYTYDEAGNISSALDAKGQLLTYSYDALNRLTEIDAAGISNDYHYEYDDCSNGAGRLCRVRSATSIIAMSYDVFGAATSHQSIAYGYDSASRVNSITYPSGAVVSLGYDSTGKVNEVDLTRNGSTVALASGINYEPFGPIESLTYGNTKTLTQQHDTAYRITSQNVAGIYARSCPVYDASGNLKQRDDSIAASSEVYFYDPLNRLDTATGEFGTRDYNYDKNGNRTQLNDGTVTTYSYENNSNRLDSKGTEDVVLDANGNTINSGTRSYTHTPFNRLFEVYDAGVLKATYSYNALGQRTRKILPDGSGRQYYYGLNGALLAESDLNGNVLAEYIYLNGQLLAMYHPDSDADGNSNMQQNSSGTNPVSLDTDGDGLNDSDELFVHGTSHLLADTDGDGIKDALEIYLNSNALDISVTLGDINASASVNAVDYVLLTQYVFGILTPNSVELAQADLDKDGQLTAEDMKIMQRALIGLSTAGLEQFIKELPALLVNMVDGLISSANAALGDGYIYYVHNDHLSTPKVMTDESGVKVWSAVHDPFGLATVDPSSTVALNVRFPGQYYDAETGNHYNYFRYYDPSTGRYITSDPIGLAGGLNTYAYVAGNPLNYIDPFGLDIVYNQQTGQISHTPPASQGGGPPAPVGTGYSGNGSGVNNPSAQNQPNVGPIPQGSYDIGQQFNSPNTGPGVLPLKEIRIKGVRLLDIDADG